MEPTAIFLNKYNKETQRRDPLMVITVTDEGVDAAGHPDTMSAEVARSLVESMKHLPQAERPEAYADLIDRYRNGKIGYAGVIEVLPLEGGTLDRATAILKEFKGK